MVSLWYDWGRYSPKTFRVAADRHSNQPDPMPEQKPVPPSLESLGLPCHATEVRSLRVDSVRATLPCVTLTAVAKCVGVAL